MIRQAAERILTKPAGPRLKRAAGLLQADRAMCRASPGSPPAAYIESLAITIANGFVPESWTMQSVFAMA